MGVYIRGMEMPKRGMVVNIYADGRVTNHFDEFGKTIGKAVSAPPHGKLIDADAIPYKKIMLDDDGEFYYGVTQPYIDRMPTIIPAEPCNDLAKT